MSRVPRTKQSPTQSRLTLAAGFISLVALLSSQPAPREQVGPLPNGAFLLNSGWRLAPAGKQVPLENKLMSERLTRDGKYLLVLNRGWKPPSISVIEAVAGRVKETVPVSFRGLGLAISHKGDFRN